MPQFRRKPVVISAVQWDGDQRTHDTITAWTGGKVRDAESDNALIIPTLEGNLRADLNDWIIQGVKGECGLCKPDIFPLTYEPA